MRLFPGLVITKGNLAAIMAGVLLIGFIGLLVGVNYQSQVKLQRSTLDHLRKDTEKRSMGLGYFSSERKNDIKGLASIRAISAFFENKALGMSMEYGLQASLLNISEIFDRFSSDRKLGEDRIYTRIVFIDSSGKLLVDSQTVREKQEFKEGWKRFLMPERSEADIVVICDGRFLRLIVSVPYFFKTEYAGQIMAWISPQAVYRLVEETKGAWKQSVIIISGEGLLPLPADMQYYAYLPSLLDLISTKTGKIDQFEVVNKYGAKVDILAIRVPVKDTPLSLVTFLPSSEVFGPMAPWHLPLAMGALAIIILAGMAIALRINTHKLILHTRLEEASKREQEIEEKNRQLGREIAERKMAEEKLRNAHDELEIRVEERTKELAESNVLLKQEITERKQAEEKLHREKEKFRILVEESPLGVSIIGEDGRYKYINPKFIEIFGYTLEDISTGREWFAKVYPNEEHRNQVISAWISILKEPKRAEARPQIFTVTCKDGSKKVLHFFRPVTMETGEHFVTYEDITERKRLEAQLLQAQKMEAIGILAGGVAHDFNNILQTIQGYTDLAMMKVDETDPLYRDLKQIDLSAGRAASLTRQLLLFSRRQQMEFTPINLNTTVDNLLKMLHRLIGEDISIKTELDSELWTIQADAGTIEQTIMNLTVNARDAMPEGGTLTIKTENMHVDEDYCKTYTYAHPGRFVCLTVEDTGVGMDKETIQHIFEPFFSTKGTGKGTGLGLSVVYGIVKQHEGWLNVYSEPGQGSTFKVYLPAVSLKPEEETKEKISLGELQGNGERILLVEDEEGVREFAKRALCENGYVVFEAANGQEALNIFEKESGNFDLIFSDVVLPGKTGLQLVDQLLSGKGDLRVLLSSGYTDHKSQWPLIRERGFRFLQKPYALTDLLRAIREAIGQDKLNLKK